MGASGVTAIHTYNDASEYPVKLIVFDDTGLTSRLTKSVTVHTDEPIARIRYTPDRSKANEVITFDASTLFDTTGKIVKYIWDFDMVVQVRKLLWIINMPLRENIQQRL